jgi:hypothetical protein
MGEWISARKGGKEKKLCRAREEVGNAPGFYTTTVRRLWRCMGGGFQLNQKNVAKCSRATAKM